MNAVTLETVETFAKTNVTGSYLQENRHALVSERFQPIQPAAIGDALANKGFDLVSLLTGRGRHADKRDFQRTISRYRSRDAFEIEGLQLDIIYISKHLGRGCDEIRLGLYRGVCANQWSVGTLFEIIRFRHTGNPLQDVENGIMQVLSQRGKLIEAIQRMQSIQLNATQIDTLAKEYAAIRLGETKNVASVSHHSLAAVRRNEDAKTDLFTVANVLQENALRHTLPYTLNATDNKGVPYLRHMHTRRLRESSVQLVELNAKFFDAALKLAA